MKNENKIDEMCHIMDVAHKYVPTLSLKRAAPLPHGDNFEYDDTELWGIPFGGDQLTVARARGAMLIRDVHKTQTAKLNGLIPVVEDWHSKMTLLKVKSIL